MVASPEICRANGRLSCGPRSERGKAIAAKNATRHGLLSQKPPLLVTEDLETFQGIVQGLIDEYQPQTPTDHLLIQQVAMGWQRLHRLWGVEAAIANLEMIRLERAAKYPAASLTTLIEETEQVHQSSHSLVVLKAERKVAHELKNAVEEWLYALPKRGFKQWLVSQEGQATVTQLQKILSESRSKLPALSIPPPSSDQFPSSLSSKLIYAGVSIDFWLCGESRSAGNLRAIAQTVIDGCLSRIEEIDAILSDQARLEQAEQQAAITSLGIVPEQELLSRYERHINHTLHQALDRLESIRQQRKQAGSIGSFRQVIGSAMR